MSFAHAFGKTEVQKSAIRQLVPGAIVKSFQRMDDGKKHEKRFVVVEVSDSVVTCVINTNIPRLYSNNSVLLNCQVEVTTNDHPFMDHLSHLDCSKVMSFKTADAIAQLVDKPEWILGTASNALLGNMVAALASSPLLTPGEVSSYCGSLSSALVANTCSATTPVVVGATPSKAIA